MTADEILKTDTSKKNICELVDMLDSEIFDDPERFGEEVYKLRVRKEEETGIPMEEDAFGRQEADMKRSLGISFDDED
ncbi:MAG: hypothetical protein IJG18_07965 [Kiritimatiellae bacterium]|jgi:hypothetical protein|nr:hypothetical protein [Kiritimatiellia bacterium]